MNGLMMQQPLLIASLLTHAERNHADQEIVTRRVEGDIHRMTYADLGVRSRQMANVMAKLGVKFGDRVGTNEPVGVISDPLGASQVAVVAEEDGIIIGRTNLPIVNRGDALFHVARVNTKARAQAHAIPDEDEII